MTSFRMVTIEMWVKILNSAIVTICCTTSAHKKGEKKEKIKDRQYLLEIKSDFSPSVIAVQVAVTCWIELIMHRTRGKGGIVLQLSFLCITVIPFL